MFWLLILLSTATLATIISETNLCGLYGEQGLLISGHCYHAQVIFIQIGVSKLIVHMTRTLFFLAHVTIAVQLGKF